jgi:NADH-quinone oxidoreductase subunit M
MTVFAPEILPWLLLIPFIGGLLAWQTERISAALPRWIALFTMLSFFIITCLLWLQGGYSGGAVIEAIGNTPQWQLEFQRDWIPRFGISFHLALDGLSLIMLLLTGLLGMMAVVCSWKEIDKHVGFFHLNLLWNLGGVAGVFLAVDLFLFFFFWEMMLVPMYFLIALWGHKGATGRSRISAATKFFIYTQASGLLLLIAIIGLVLISAQTTGVLTFDYEDLLNTSMAPAVEMVLMLGFFIAFAVKLPVVPFHSWLPDAHAQAPTAGSVDLAMVCCDSACRYFPTPR